MNIKQLKIEIEEAALAAIVNEFPRDEVSFLDMCDSLGIADADDFTEEQIAEFELVIDRAYFLHTEAKTYEVGGCVRDQFMGIEPKDRDYVVVGTTPEQMLAHGFSQVGAAFPVFLHPVTGDEYALARTERKNDKGGYHGFDVDFSSKVTLEEDLYRRDFTINAMARDCVSGKLHDPHGGHNDLANQCIRMVNPDAFTDDPLRTLRALRFSSRYPMFYITGNTFEAMLKIAGDGKLNELPYERIWAEIQKVYKDAVTGAQLASFWEGVASLNLHMNTAFFTALIGVGASNTAGVYNTLILMGQNVFSEPVMAAFPDMDWQERLRASLVRAVSVYTADEYKAGRALLATIDAEAAELVKQIDILQEGYVNKPDANAAEVMEILALSYFSLRLEQPDRIKVAHRMDYINVCAGAYHMSLVRDIAVSWSKVKAGQFPGAEGRELGQAIRRKRIEILTELFNRAVGG